MLVVPVRVITDTAAALDPEVAQARGIRLVPISVNIGDHSYRDGEISLRELIDRVDEGVRTAGPAPGAFLEALDETDDGAVIVTVASALSSTHASAAIAARERDGRIRVIDTGTAAGAQALVALHAAEIAGSGADLGAVAEAATRAVEQVRLFGALETLEYLIRGGRVNGLVGNIAGSLGLRPVFELRNGEIRRHRPAFSRRGSIERLYGIWKRSAVEGARLHCIALHALARAEAEELLGRVVAHGAPATALVAEFGAGMVAHTGPGLIGLSWWWEEPA